MSKQYNGFTKEEHESIAQEINSVCKILSGICSKILPVYGVSSPVGKEIQKLVLTPNVMTKLKDKLDDAFFKEHRGELNDSPYFDGRGYA